MKRYALFAGDNYYPGGGWSDFAGSFDSALDAVAEGQRLLDGTSDWWQVIDLQTGRHCDDQGRVS